MSLPMQSTANHRKAWAAIHLTQIIHRARLKFVTSVKLALYKIAVKRIRHALVGGLNPFFVFILK